MASWRLQPQRLVLPMLQQLLESSHLPVEGRENQCSSRLFLWQNNDIFRSAQRNMICRLISIIIESHSYILETNHSNDLMLIGVKSLWVDTSVADDVAVGFRNVSSPAAEVSINGAAVHQVLWTQGNHDACVLLHLALKSSQSTEGPAGATCALRKTTQNILPFITTGLLFRLAKFPSSIRWSYLVLDWANQTVLPPVHTLRCR